LDTIEQTIFGFEISREIPFDNYITLILSIDNQTSPLFSFIKKADVYWISFEPDRILYYKKQRKMLE